MSVRAPFLALPSTDYQPMALVIGNAPCAHALLLVTPLNNATDIGAGCKSRVARVTG